MLSGNHTRTGKVTNLRGIYIFCKFLSFLNRSIGFPYRTVQIIFSVKKCNNISAIKDIFHRIKGGGWLKCNIIVLSALIQILLDCFFIKAKPKSVIQICKSSFQFSHSLKEQIALVFKKVNRAIRSFCPSHSLSKERQEGFAHFALLKRAIQSRRSF